MNHENVVSVADAGSTLTVNVAFPDGSLSATRVPVTDIRGVGPRSPLIVTVAAGPASCAWLASVAVTTKYLLPETNGAPMIVTGTVAVVEPAGTTTFGRAARRSRSPPSPSRSPR